MRLLLALVRPGLGLGLFAAACWPAQAAWRIDPDFRPRIYVENALPPITAILPDGGFIVNHGTQRLRADGSLDPDYHSTIAYDRVLVSPTGQLIAGTRPLVWLAADGRPSGVSINSTTEADIEDFGAQQFLRINVAGFRADGSLIVYGAFQALNGIARPGIARILHDGIIDLSFSPPDLAALLVPANPDPDFWRSSRAALQSDGKIVVLARVGTTYDTIRLLRLNADGSLDATFDPGADVSTSGLGNLTIDALDRIITDRRGASGRDLWRQDANGANPVTIEASTTVRTLWPEADGSVFVELANGYARILADGSITAVTPASGGIFAVAHGRLHAQSGTRIYTRMLPDGTLDPALDLAGAEPAFASVYAIAPAPDGKVVVGGTFTHVDGVARPGVARLNADGSLDPTFDPVAPAPWITSIAAQADGRVVGGSNELVRFNTDGTLDSSFDAALSSPPQIRAVAVLADDRLVVAGAFNSVGGVARPGLARLLPTGALDPTFVPPQMSYFSIEVLPDEKLLVGGALPSEGQPSSQTGALRLNHDGSIDAQFRTPQDANIWLVSSASAGPDGSVSVLGSYGSGFWRTTLVQFDPLGGLRDIGSSERWRDVTDSYPDSVLRDQGGSIVTLRRFGDDTNYALERYTDDGEIDPIFGIELGGGGAHHLTYDGAGRILVGGDFVRADGMEFAGALRLIRDDAPAPRLANVSTRGYVGSGDEVLIGGFYVDGTQPQRVLVRGVAENLATFGVPGIASDVRVTVYRNGDNRPIHQGDSWIGHQQQDPSATRIFYAGERVGAFPLQVFPLPGGGLGSSDTAAEFELEPGGYTVHLAAASPGIGLIEVYDANGIGADRRLINLSTRGRVGTGDERMIAGFVVDRGTKRLLIRAVGPAIAGAVSGVLLDPQLELVRQSDQTVLTTNDNWGDNAKAADIATVSLEVSGLQLADGSADAALLVDLPPGGYTVIVSGVGETGGIALAEVYEVASP